jgi:hypothetical protein
MLLASRKLGVPMIIGSAGTRAPTAASTSTSGSSGARAKHRLPPFKLGYFYSEIGKEELRRRMRAGETVAGLEGYDDLTEAELDATERIVAMAGVHPFIKLLEAGADVIIGGRSSDSCVFAAPAIHHGFPRTFRITSARCSNARRSAPSRTAARRRCWAKSRPMP